MGGNSLTSWNDDSEAWEFLKSRGYTHTKGSIHFRPEKRNSMPEDESSAIDYLFYEWDWEYA